jgi:hypothetical protein
LDESRREFIDIGYWIDLRKGKIYKTCNYRPYRAMKHIKEEDSFFSKARIKLLYVYPGDINKRIRWEDMTLTDIENTDYDRIVSFADKSYVDVIKNVKNSIKNPLADKNPVVLLYYATLGKTGNEYAIEDLGGKRIMLRDIPDNKEHLSTHMLHLLGKGELRDGAMLVRFEHNLVDEKLTAHPLSIITRNSITRLVY